jgi:hypothetical protein
MFARTTSTHSLITLDKSASMQAIIDQGAPGLLGQHWHLVQTFITAHTPYTPADVAAFSVFTTQAVNPDYTSVQEFVTTQGVAVDRNIGLQGRYRHQDCL